MDAKRFWAALLGMQLLVLTDTAQANPFMPTGARASQPIGHYEFCRTHPAECSTRSAAANPVRLTKALWAEIIEVNDFVNLSVAPLTDLQLWGREEVWSFPDGVGDCEDYAIEKRRRLMERGLPSSSLLITVVRQPSGAGHAVLTVRTDRGDLVLDNLEARVLPWTATSYTFLKRQSERSSGAWVSVEDGRATTVGSVR